VPQLDINIEDPDQLLTYLHKTKRILPTDKPQCVTMAGGVSSRTVWVQRETHPDWIIKQSLEKLRVQVDWFSAPERIHIEAHGLRCLSTIIPNHVPAFVFEDLEFHILAMSAIPQPHDNWKTLLLTSEPDINHAIQFGELLAYIHNAVETDDEVVNPFSDTTFFTELRLEPYYAYSGTQIPQAQKFLHELIADTQQRKQTLVHGDYSPKNVLVYENRLYILDYEVMHFGDPAFDIGFSLTHLLSKAHYRKMYRHNFIRMASAYWQTYATAISQQFLSQSLEIYAVRHTLACLMARAYGRSPLEYLDSHHRQRQRDIVLDLLDLDIKTMAELINRFEQRLELSEHDN
jgi:fructosamine-3-kinase